MSLEYYVIVQLKYVLFGVTVIVKEIMFHTLNGVIYCGHLSHHGFAKDNVILH